MLAIIKKNYKPGINLEEVERPSLGIQPLVRIEAAALCGSDIHMFEDMTSYGHVITPVIMGHEACGVIEDPGESELVKGQRVVIDSVLSCGKCYYCRTGRENLCINRKTVGQQFDGVFAKYASLPERICIPVPNSLPAEVGACLEPLGVSLRSIEQADLRPGDNVAIIGPGPIGLMALMLCKLSGAGKIAMVGTRADEKRLETARNLGATSIVYSPEELDEHKGKYNCVFEWSGSKGGLISATELVEPGGTIVAGAIYNQQVPLNMTGLVRREITLKTSRSRTFQTWTRAIELVSNGVIDLSPIITHRYHVTDAQIAFEKAAAKESVKTILTFD